MRRRNRRRRGQALVETALVLPLLLVMTFAVVGIGRLTQAQMAVSAVAREAARTGALANSAHDAQSDGETRGYEVGDGYNLSHPPLQVHVNPNRFGRCGTVSAHVSYTMNLKDLPLLGWASYTLQSDHTEPVDGYRSHLAGQCP